jgi:hypothetical protein
MFSSVTKKTRNLIANLRSQNCPWRHMLFPKWCPHAICQSYDIYAPCQTELRRGHTIFKSRELMWCYACSWDVRGALTLNSMTQIHTSVTLLTSRDLTWSSGRLTRQHASHICCRTHFVRRAGAWADQSSTWRKQSDRRVNPRHRIQC